MTARLFVACSVLLVSLLSALSLGGRVFYLVSWTVGLMIAYALLSVLVARRLVRVRQSAADNKVERGSSSTLYMDVHNRCLLPIAPLRMRLTLPQGDVDMPMDVGPLKQQSYSVPFFLPHVGVVRAGAGSVRVQDLFRMFRFKLPRTPRLAEVTVLPRSFDVEKLEFLMDDEGKALPNRVSEDLTSPEDTRNYRQGDPLKRIHWKLSSRKRELVVRRFEMPAPPDTLILMDCSDPQGGEAAPDGLARLKDTLCETALSVARMQVEGSQPVRVPLYGVRAGEFKADRAGTLPMLQEELAYQIFRGGEPFPRVLNVELRRMRRTGATIVITTRLDAQIVEGVKHIRRSGPSVRFYLVTFTPEEPAYAPYVRQLQQQLVEVCYVTPA